MFEHKSSQNQQDSLSLANWSVSKCKQSHPPPVSSSRIGLTAATQGPGCHWNTRPHSPRVHFQPGFQLPCFGCVCTRKDFPTLHVDHLHWQVTHLTGLVQRLKESPMSPEVS